jgi:fluoroacetyl-CoA thioesterase
LKPGLRVDFSYRVPADRTVPRLLPEAPEFGCMPEVLATGYMVALFEWACILAVNPHLDGPEEQSVGTHIDLSHVAATPPGLTVRVQGRLTQVEGRKLTFVLEADDGVDLISRGTHERFVIRRSQFERKMREKSEAARRGAEGRGSRSPPVAT